MGELAGLLVLVACGFVAGLVVRRWWLLAVVAAAWLVVGGFRLASHGDESEPSIEWMVVLVAATVVGALAAAALGIGIGRALASPAKHKDSRR